MPSLDFPEAALGKNPVQEIFKGVEIERFRIDVKTTEISRKLLEAGAFEKIAGEQEIHFMQTPEGIVFNAQ